MGAMPGNREGDCQTELAGDRQKKCGDMRNSWGQTGNPMRIKQTERKSIKKKGKRRRGLQV